MEQPQPGRNSRPFNTKVGGIESSHSRCQCQQRHNWIGSRILSATRWLRDPFSWHAPPVVFALGRTSHLRPLPTGRTEPRSCDSSGTAANAPVNPSPSPRQPSEPSEDSIAKRSKTHDHRSVTSMSSIGLEGAHNVYIFGACDLRGRLL